MIEVGLLPYVSRGTVLGDTNATVVYTCPADMLAQITQIWFADDGGEARTVTVTWTDQLTAAGGGPTTYTLCFTKAIAVVTQTEMAFNRLALDPGDVVTVTASAAGVHVTVNVIEYDRR